jgi:hypothetical protein
VQKLSDMSRQQSFLISRNFETYKCKFIFICKYIPRIGANVKKKNKKKKKINPVIEDLWLSKFSTRVAPVWPV